LQKGSREEDLRLLNANTLEKEMKNVPQKEEQYDRGN